MSEKLSSKQMMSQQLLNHFAGAMAAKQKGELVGWATSIFPQEFIETMGLTAVYPENQAAMVAAKHGAQPLIDAAENVGYDVDLCSYAKLGLGYSILQKAEIPLPMPDFVCCCNNICNTVLKWYENLATELNIPLILIDIPFNHEYQPGPEAVAYVKGQFEHAIKQLEDLTGKKFDYDRFNEVMHISQEVSRAWKRVIDLGKTIPAPLNGFDSFNYMALIVAMRGKKETLDCFNRLIEELEEKVARGESAYQDGEKYRVMWDGIACWPYVGQNMRYFKEHGINIVASLYPDAWLLMYEPGNLEELALAYATVGNNSNMEFQSDRRTQMVRNFSVDGVVFHINRSCKVMDFMQYEQQRMLAARTGVPMVTFDGDQSDPRNFSQAQFETRMEALMEMIDQAKAAKAGKK